MLHGMFYIWFEYYIMGPDPPPFPYNTTRKYKTIFARSYNKEQARACWLARVC
jgi:hypothetical protein